LILTNSMYLGRLEAVSFWRIVLHHPSLAFGSALLPMNEGRNMEIKKEIIKPGYRYPTWIQSSVCLFGLVLYFASFSPFIVTLQIIPEIARQIGIGIFIFGLTSFALTHYYSKLMTEQIETLSKEIKSLTLDAFDLVKSSRASGISRIYALRTGELTDGSDGDREFRKRIQFEFEEAGKLAIQKKELTKIRMIGISQRDFFNDAGKMFQLAENALHNDFLQFEILLVDPFSAQAGLRSERESQTKEEQEYQTVDEHFTSTLFQDMQKCTRTLMRFIEPQNDRVQVRLYSTAPSCMLIFINESVFVETYHYGRSGVGGLKGGKVPVLEFHSDTNTYKELSGHFDHVWFKSRHRKLDKKLAELINAPRIKPEAIDRLKKEFFWVSGCENDEAKLELNICDDMANKANTSDAKSRAAD